MNGFYRLNPGNDLVGIGNHPGTRRPLAAAARGLATIRENSYDFNFKLILVGDTHCGKTALLQRFRESKFSIRPSTLGVDIVSHTAEVNGKVVRFQFWDTAGQERFRCLTTNYYKGAHGVMLVFDITNRETFENLTRWLAELKQHVSDEIPRIIVGNKADLSELRQVELRDIADLMCDMGDKRLPYFEVSALNGRNVQNAFLALPQEIIKWKENADAEAELLRNQGGSNWHDKGDGFEINASVDLPPLKSSMARLFRCT